MEAGPSVCCNGHLVSGLSRADGGRLIPMMGACYMMQYMDKYVLSQTTLFNLREDLVCFLCDWIMHACAYWV